MFILALKIYLFGFVLFMLFGYLMELLFEEKPINDWLGVFVFSVLVGFYWPLILIEVIKILVEYIKDWFDNLPKKPAPQHEVLNFRTMSGQQIDAYLTQLHKEKNGWN